jgi:hypothetical protein
LPNDQNILKNLVQNMKRRGSDPLRPLLDAYLLERDASETRYELDYHDLRERLRPGGRISPSDLCGCERAAVFKFIGVKGKRRISPDLQLIFDDGNWRHLKWQTTFHDMEAVLGRERFRVISTEAKVQFSDLYISGSLDNVLWLKPHPSNPGRKWVVDIKGINKAGFEFILRNDEPIEKHVKQLVTYEKAAEVPRGLLWYECKDNQSTKAFIVNADDSAWHEVEGWATSVVSFLERRRLPPMDPDCVQGNITYERCPYASQCYGSGLDKVELGRKVYRRFPGVDEAWEEGNRVASGDS